MQATEVLYGHELADLTQEEQLFEAADLNGIGITDVLTPGVILSIPDPLPQKKATKIASTEIKTVPGKSVAGQVWVDIAIQELGDEERLFELCDLNGVGITDDLNAGTALNSPVADSDKRRLVNVMRKAIPASLFYGVGNPEPEGIEYWAIEIDFIVS